MSKEGRTALESEAKEADGCDEERRRRRPATAARGGSDGGSFSLKACHGVFCAAVALVHEGWCCPHLQRLSHWHQSGRWGRRRGRGTKKG